MSKNVGSFASCAVAESNDSLEKPYYSACEEEILTGVDMDVFEVAVRYMKAQTAFAGSYQSVTGRIQRLDRIWSLIAVRCIANAIVTVIISS